MADTNISHKDVGTQLSKVEWEAADTHVATHSIADNAVVTVDDASAADNEYAKFTASGLEGRTYAEVLSDLGITDALVYKGVIDCSTTPDYPAADAGHVYKVSVAGKIGGSSGIVVEAGDTLICTTDGTVSGNQATVGAYWNIIQANIDGALTHSDVDDAPVDTATDVPISSNWAFDHAALATHHTQGTDTALGTLGTKDPPIDADKLPYRDSTASDALVTSTFTQVKAFLKTYFDTLYTGGGIDKGIIFPVTAEHGDALYRTDLSRLYLCKEAY